MAQSGSLRTFLNDAFTGDRAARVTSFILATIISLLLLGILLAETGILAGNPTPSVPRGIYRTANPEKATYVTFCLGIRHRSLQTYSGLCSPDTPDETRLIKRITTRNADGSLTVEGDTPRALDSRFLGRIRPEEIHGWWRPLLTEDMLPFTFGGDRR